jgi:hypothetical protein
VTPIIHIWHNEDKIVHWKPVDGSFRKGGADGLWRNRPSTMDILDAMGGHDGDIVLHAILESGRDSAGDGLDTSPFFDPSLMKRISAASVEPIVFPDDETGIVSREDIDAVILLINGVKASLLASYCSSGDDDNDKRLLMISPDRPCYDALISRRAERHRTRGAAAAANDDNDCDDDYATRGGRIKFAMRNCA